MLGIMNCGTYQVEFYGTNKQSSLYKKKPSKESRTYDEKGRVFINGVPTEPEKAEDLWQDMIQRVASEKMIKHKEGDKESTEDVPESSTSVDDVSKKTDAETTQDS